MIFNCYSLFDSVDGAYGTIMLHRSDARAAKTVSDTFTMKNKEASAKGYPETPITDYRLYKVGSFDDTSGSLLSCDPVLIPFAGGDDL